jgi:PAS domain S-box-containing protein
MKNNHHELPRLYNIRILRTYVEYVEKYYRGVNMDGVLESAGLTRAELADDGYWCTQEQVDNFHKILDTLTRNPDIGREAGKYTVYSKAYRPVRQYIFGFISPSTAYSLSPKIGSKLSKGTNVSVQILNPNRIELISRPFPGVEEKPYQCQNRIGHIEALGAAFTGQYSTVEHPSCFHRGDKECRYIISWHEPLFLKLRRWRNILFLYGVLICGALSFFIPYHYNMLLLSAAVALLAGLTFTGWYFEKNDYKKQVAEQALTAESLMFESDTRSNDARLVQEIGQAISSVLDIDMLLATIMQTLKLRLDFDRGIVLLANNDKTHLMYKSGFGFTPEQEDHFSKNDIPLSPESRDPYTVTFRERKPFFVDDVSNNTEPFSDGRQGLHMFPDTGAFICVPIIFEDQALGVLSVDRATTSTPLRQNDRDMLMGIAPQIAISIHNARTFEKMEESEEKYRDLVESANSIILRLDTKGNITFANLYAQKFYGYAQHEMVGMNIAGTIVPDIDSKGRPSSLQIERFLNDPEQYVALEIQNLRMHGHTAWVSWSNRAIRDKDGNIIEILCVGNDITARKQAEEEKSRLEDQLLRVQKMEAIGALAGGVAHDLNNILSGLTSYPELLLMQIPEESPMRKVVTTIKKSGDKAAAMVQDLLTLARRGVSISNVVDLNAIVRDYFESHEFAKLKEYHPQAEFIVKLDNDLKGIMGSEVHLSKTLMNLISNAAEAMPAGGIITVSTGNRHLEMPLKGYDTVAKGEYAVLTVTDSGIGISQDDLNKIFEPFFTKKSMGRSGTGLGMTVVWSTVKDHKGYIDVESIEGIGTRFDIYFPVTQLVAVQKEEKGSIDDYKGTESILVVDDSEEQREITKSLLEKIGYAVDVVVSGEKAAEYIKEHDADLVILDMILEPGMDGFDTYRKILETREKQKAIIVSGFSETDRVRETIRLGAGSYLKKPYALIDLARAVRTELDRQDNV